MKRECLFPVLVFIVLSSFLVFAQDAPKVLPNVSNASKLLGELGLEKSVFTQPLSTEIEIPSELQIFAKILFGFNAFKESGKVNLMQFVILTVLFLTLFVLIFEATRFFFRKIWQSLLVALIVTSLGGIGGGILIVSRFLFSLSEFIHFFDGIPALKLLLVVVFFALALLIVAKILNIIREQAAETVEETEGKKAGLVVGLLSRVMKSFSGEKGKKE